jgi:SAM-dependent methyltransferase
MIYTFWKVRQFEKREEKYVSERYYTDSRFRAIDLCLKRAYRWNNPYRVSRKYWGESTYGETPLSTLEILGRKLKLGPSDRFVDLGSGRGRGVFFMKHYFDCKAIGVERVSSFVRKANEIKSDLQVKGVEFREEDLSSLDNLEGSVFYVAWTCFSEELVHEVIGFFERLPKGVKIVTLSEPIESKRCRMIESFTSDFAWGNGEVYIHETL